MVAGVEEGGGRRPFVGRIRDHRTRVGRIVATSPRVTRRGGEGKAEDRG